MMPGVIGKTAQKGAPRSAGGFQQQHHLRQLIHLTLTSLQEAAQMQPFDTTPQRQFRGALRSNRAGSNHQFRIRCSGTANAVREQIRRGHRPPPQAWDRPHMGLFKGMKKNKTRDHRPAMVAPETISLTILIYCG
jgi:hypothetical protein